MCWITDLLKGFATTEIASPSDIIPKGNITVNQWDDTAEVVIDYLTSNIPFTKPPHILPILSIPDTNSMDGLMDYGHNPLYIVAADEENHKILCDWLADEWTKSKGMLANDCVYRIPPDFSQPAIHYSIHRIHKVGMDAKGRYWKFKGINNSIIDAPTVRDENILWLNTGVIF